MPTVDWDTVAQQAVAAAAGSLGASWKTVANTASHSVQSLVLTAKYIAENADKLDQADRQLLTDNQKLAMQNVLIGYQAIGIAAAEEAVAAAWGVIRTALGTALSAAAI